MPSFFATPGLLAGTPAAERGNVPAARPGQSAFTAGRGVGSMSQEEQQALLRLFSARGQLTEDLRKRFGGGAFTAPFAGATPAIGFGIEE